MESWKSAKHGIVLCALYFVPGRWSLPASGEFRFENEIEN